MKKLLLLLFLSTTITFNAQTWTNYDIHDGLIQGIVSSLIINDVGELWFSSWGANLEPGIGSFDGVNWNTLGTDDGAPRNEWNSTFQDSEGNYWFTMFGSGGITKYDGTTWTNYDVTNGLVSDFMFYSIEDSENNLWFTGNGVSKFDGNTFTNYALVNGEEFIAESMLEDADGNFWFGSSIGLLKFDGTNWEVFTSADGFSTDRPGAIFLDSNNNLWVTSYQNGTGIDMYDGTNVTSYSFSDGINNIDVRYSNAIAEDSAGNIYFGTNFGIAVFDGTNWSSIGLADGLPEEHVRTIVIDDEGIFWISTFVGLSAYNPTLGIFDNLKTDFALYPNPANDVLHIKAETELSEISIYSMLGAEVQKIAQNNINQIDISSIAQGAYWVKVTSSDGLTGFKKVIIK